MALLNLLPPSVTGSQNKINEQVYNGFTSIQNWQSLILSNQDVNYRQDENNNPQNSNFTIDSINYIAIPNFIFNFVPKNTLALITGQLTLLGTGYIGIFNNGSLLLEIPFACGSFSQVNILYQYKFAVINNKISLSLRSNGTVTLAQTKAQAFLNLFQIFDMNS